MKEKDYICNKKSAMEEDSDKYIRFDWMVKRILRDKGNFGVLDGFIADGLPTATIIRISGRSEDVIKKL